MNSPNPEAPIRWSVLIPTWNRADILARTLEGLEALRLPEGDELEVLVCDNNSNDRTRQVVEECADRLPVRYLHEPRQGKGYALVQLIAEARGNWLLFLDDDVLVDPGLLAAYRRGMARYPEAKLFGGPIHPWLERPVSGTRAFLIEHYHGVHALLKFDEDRRMVEGKVEAYGPNMLFEASIMRQPESVRTDIGMFQGKRVSGVDVAMVNHQLGKGYEGWLIHDAVVKHYIPLKRTGVRYFCRWNTGWGRAWVFKRGRPEPGRWGVPWWAWREFARRAARATMDWRPWPTKDFYDRLAEACHFWGWLTQTVQ
ncbi:MAG: glycosyltransferase family 2 protein [Phycisphaeraceae bacterium]|nr:glycosyltransferase family 2 protein [Phycisphaeraceae bacterium]